MILKTTKGFLVISKSALNNKNEQSIPQLIEIMELTNISTTSTSER